MKYLSVLLMLLAALMTGCSSSGDYTELFNGKDFTGWKGTAGMDSYEIKDGIMKVQSTGGGQHLLYSAKQFKDFELVVVSKSEPRRITSPTSKGISALSSGSDNVNRFFKSVLSLMMTG